MHYFLLNTQSASFSLFCLYFCEPLLILLLLLLLLFLLLLLLLLQLFCYFCCTKFFVAAIYLFDLSHRVCTARVGNHGHLVLPQKMHNIPLICFDEHVQRLHGHLCPRAKLFVSKRAEDGRDGGNRALFPKGLAGGRVAAKGLQRL